MQYNLSNELDRERLMAKLAKDIERGVVVDYTAKVMKTVSQNRYLHLLIGVAAMECGTSIEYAKAEYFKRLVNHELFAFDSEDAILGKVTEKLRSINEIPCEDLSKAIDKFKTWGREQGWVMPDAEDMRLMQLIETEMSHNRWL
ncbi:MAG: hypothetical protein KBS70_04045 [Bacteroidales bacterium]|nr:hypothetical protein [Candidatus Colicola equi]